MSVQLIVYPQNYDGYESTTFTSTDEFLVDGINFNTVNYSPLYVMNPTSIGIQGFIDLADPTLPVNTWVRGYNVSTISSISSNVNELSIFINSSPGAIQIVCLAQKLSNLIIGQVYTVTVDIDVVVDTANTFGFWVFEGTVLQNVLPIHSGVAGIHTTQFTANSTEDTIVITGDSTIGQILVINSISIENETPIPGDTVIIGDGQVICDLYEDEDLPLTLSVDDFKNVADKVQSYSKAFNLPATKRNNRIFDQMFEITRSDDGLIFNPYKKTKCTLKQDGFLLFEGYLRMLDITDKNGEISYNVNLYSEVVALADVLKDRIFSDLDFNELDHVYNYSNIRNSWQGILALNNALLPGSFAGTTGSSATSVLRYPFVDWNHQFTVGSGGNPVLPNTESAFRPFISIKYLIDIIFAGTPFTYSSDFFNTAEFDKLYMDFNWGANESGATTLTTAQFTRESDSALYTFPSTYTPFKLNINAGGTPGTLWDNSNYRLISDINNLEVQANFILYLENNNIGAKGNSVRISKFNSSAQVLEVFQQDDADIPGTFSGNNVKTFQGSFTTILQLGEYIQAQASSPGNNVRIFPDTPSTLEFSLNNENAQVLSLLNEIRGDVGQWEFIKGLITMFNLVTLPDIDNPSNIKIEPYRDIFGINSDGEELNWTDKIDVSEMKLTPLTDLNKQTIFKFEKDDDDSAFNQYKKIFSGKIYGSKTFPETSNPILDSFNILEGQEEIVATPFAATVIKSLMPDYPELIVPTIYAMEEDEVKSSFDNLPRIMYHNGVKTLANMTYEVKPQNGVGGDPAEDQYLQFSHFSTMPISASTSDFNFGELQLMPNVVANTINNLFNTYWLPYYAELYNPDTRIMTIKVNLSPSDINTFKFNNTVFIKNRTFRVNKINYKPNDLATVEFILIP